MTTWLRRATATRSASNSASASGLSTCLVRDTFWCWSSPKPLRALSPSLSARALGLADCLREIERSLHVRQGARRPALPHGPPLWLGGRRGHLPRRADHCRRGRRARRADPAADEGIRLGHGADFERRSEEHTSELQSPVHL